MRLLTRCPRSAAARISLCPAITPPMAAKILGVRTVVPVHCEGWTHFKQGADRRCAAFVGNGVSDRLALAGPGAMIEL